MGIVQLPPEPRHGCEIRHPYTQSPRNVRLSHILMSFLLINIYGSSMKKHVQTTDMVQTKLFIR